MKQFTKMFLFCFFAAFTLAVAKKEDSKIMDAGKFSGLKMRSIGPAITSGRVIDFAVDPNDFNTFFVAYGSGGVWKTTNKGTSFTPIFDAQKSYSIGCITIDPTNSNVVWVGSGENNSQRAVSYGDGVYKSEDGGKTWKNVGLKTSEHIGKIIVNPKNPNIVYVASQGPLWKKGGERGLYKTEDGGKTWKAVLEISENTGISDIAMDPRDPNVIYATSYQRRRHVWTLINGGPESAVHKTVDGGNTWTKLANGLPGGELGRIGIAVSPVDPDVVYALIEAHGNKGGFFRSTDRGASWVKRNNHKTSSAQYYQELVCDPQDVDLVYFLETYTHFTPDGGKTMKKLGLKERHVDDHALWINPNNTKHMLIGGDGGVYETYDNAATWRFFEHMPVVQFYRASVDYAKPFYNVYAGTQDNNTLAGPSRTTNEFGIMNQDWSFVLGGDGFKAAIDPKNPNIAYVQYQYGGLVRADRKSGEQISIKPQPAEGEEHRWNWNAPIIISPHNNKRLYFAANKVFKSDDRGNTWQTISGDLTRQINRNNLEIMGKVWHPEAVAKNASTSLYGNIVYLSESPVKAGLLYAGTDDGLLQVSENDGQTWTKYGTFPTVPETTYVADIDPSNHNENVVYITFDNRKKGDFTPYVLKSNDKGKTWTSISSNLPKDQTVHAIEEDFVNPDLLFAGTEFGVYFTVDGGKEWTQLKGNMPSIAVRDLEIQTRENDLVMATFGRGVYIFDNFAPLREVNKGMMQKDAHIFKVKDALMYKEDGTRGTRWSGETLYRAEKHPVGAVVTFFVKEKIKSKADVRKEKFAADVKAKKAPTYSSFDELRAEDLEQKPYLIFTFSDMQGNVIRRLKSAYKTGVNRIVWDLNYPDTNPVSDKTNPNKNYGLKVSVFPGQYQVSMSKVVDGKISKIAGPVKFMAKNLDNTTLPANDKKALLAFQREMQELQRVVYGTQGALSETTKRVKAIKNAMMKTVDADEKMLETIRSIDTKLEKIAVLMTGNGSIKSRNANQTPSISERMDEILWGMWGTTSAPTTTFKNSSNVISKRLKQAVGMLKNVINADIKPLENKLDELKAPYTPGRVLELK